MMTVVYCDCGRYRAEVRELETLILELVPGLPVVRVWSDPSPGCLAQWIRANHHGCTWRTRTAIQRSDDDEEVTL